MNRFSGLEPSQLRRAALGAGLAAFAIAAAFGTLRYVRPVLGGRERMAALHAAARADQSVVAERAGLATEIDDLGARLRAGQERVPATPRLDAFVADVGRTARAHRVRIVALEPGEVRDAPPARVLPVRLVVEGEFRRIHAWMVAIEDAPRLVRCERLRAMSQPAGSVRAEVTANLYLEAAAPGGG